MPNFNSVTIIGHLTRDPEIKMLANDKSVASFTVAVSEKWKTRDGDQREDVAFIDCEAWGKPAELISQYVAKGNALLVRGKLKQDNWEDKTTGAKRSKLKIKVDEFTFMPKASTGESNDSRNETPSARSSAPASSYADDDNDPPF